MNVNHVGYQDKIGISTNILHNPEHLLNTVSQLRRVSRTIEIEFDNAARKILDYDPKQLEKVISSLVQFKHDENLYFSVHAPYLGKSTDIASCNEDERLSAVQ